MFSVGLRPIPESRTPLTTFLPSPSFGGRVVADHRFPSPEASTRRAQAKVKNKMKASSSRTPGPRNPSPQT